jgi:preprotein translocase subunit YajC
MSFHLISTAYAASDAAQATVSGPSLPPLLLLGGFFIIFYFMLWRPQHKRTQAHQELVQKIKKGDEITTNGGMLGRVTRLTDDFIVLAITDEMEVKVQRSAVVSILPKGTIKSI